ncbi:glycosyltransferase [Rothia nasimurium]|uniref:glycosyltransferase n=1 Tax=Rothia nasimurium TaxID=85336 RepID=UPI002DD6B8AF|nr:glycosyltransferase [Rothia nasimurium]
MSQYSVVILSHEVPKPEPTSAGERLIRELYFALREAGHTPIFLASVPRNGYAPAYDLPRYFVATGTRPLERAVARLTRSFTWIPNISFYMALMRDKQAMSLLQEAAVIDMQWSSNVLLAPLMRRINPTARLVGTFHDINEQRLKRRSASEPQPIKSSLWCAQAITSGLLEGLTTRFLDRTVVLSDKDRALLRAPKKVKDRVYTVIPPVYLDFSQPKLQRKPGHNVVFVGTMYRWENHQAVEWFIRQVLPLIWAKRPEIKFTVVGESPSHDLMKLGEDARIEFTGFVDDLEPIYAQATLLVSPIKLGSGVKFKTLDAILRGIPLVSTGAGIEGIAQVSWASALAESPQAFAEKVLAVLDDYETFAQKAGQSAVEASRVYSKEAYQGKIKEVYRGL